MKVVNFVPFCQTVLTCVDRQTVLTASPLILLLLEIQQLCDSPVHSVMTWWVRVRKCCVVPLAA